MKYVFLIFNLAIVFNANAQKSKEPTFLGRLDAAEFYSSPLANDSCLLDCIYLKNSKTIDVDSIYFKLHLDREKATFIYIEGKQEMKYQIDKKDRKTDMLYHIIFLKGSPESFLYDIDSIDLEKKLIFVRIHELNKKKRYVEKNRAIFSYQ